jgi:DNA polymerase-3 subunit beta
MKFRCSRAAIVDALVALTRIIPGKAVSPVLTGFMINARGETIVLQATDLDLGLTMVVPAQVEKEGSAVVTGRHLTDLVRRLPEGELTFQLLQKTQQVEILYGKDSVRINTFAPSDFPALPSVQARDSGKLGSADNPAGSIAMKGDSLKRILSKVLISAAPHEVRPNYAGVYIHLSSGRLNFVSTDTYRLARLTLPFTEEADDFAIFVPVRPLGEVSRLLEDDQQLEMLWDRTIISFQTESFTLTARLMDAQFPAYKRVIPEGRRLRIRVNRKLLSATLERASLFNEMPSQQAVLDLKVEGETLFITAESSKVGSLKEEIALDSVEGDESDGIFTTRYLLEPLKVMDRDVVTLCLNGARDPAVYVEDGDESYLHLILPVRRVENASEKGEKAS